MIKITWPEYTFPPVNLHTVTDVSWFYKDKHKDTAVSQQDTAVSRPRRRRCIAQAMRALYEGRAK